MIYPADFEAKSGFERIREQTGKLCLTLRAKELLEGIAFSSDFSVVERELARCDQMRTILMMENDFPSDGFVDIAPMLRKLDLLGAFLDASEILTLRRGLETSQSLVHFLRDKGYDRLRELTDGIESLPEIVKEIDRIIDRFGKVKDNASTELTRIRRSIAEREGIVSRRLNQLLKEGQSSGIIDSEATISIRDGRAVIPVSAANKRRIKGLIHDESATGKTFYVEPMEVVELNNELRELEYSHRREVVKILTIFTDQIRPHKENLSATGEFIATIDLIRAKARWALANECVKPLLREDPYIELHTARHPLLAQALAREGKKVIPLDLKLSKEKHILVISGPNAGGKSVCLKTVGLLQYMLQCGFLVPASENSEMGMFDSIFMDIGDEQSIDNDLSTYSSHLLNMKNILRHSSASSLVFIDEFGTGTEPVMGGAIAESVLSQLEARGVFGVITTHYSNLKYYASNAHGVINGAMSFDVQNIRPLFKLEIGKPGSSFAIEIARKIGLPEEIISSAKEKIGSEQINIERQLREIARDKRYWEGKREKIRIAEKRADETALKYEKELESLREEHNKLIKEAKYEAKRILSETNRQIETTIRTIKESQADKEKTRQARQSLDTFKESINSDDAESIRIEAKMAKLHEREQRRKEKKPEQQKDATIETQKIDITTASKVRIKGQEAMGEVISTNGSKAVVGFGQIMTTIDISRLEGVSNSEYKKAFKERNHSRESMSNYDTSKRRLNFKQQIDLRGERAVDALASVREFVDEAIMLSIPDIKILHGKGTGALKQEIRKYLETVDLVVSAIDEDEKFGGAGITVIKIDV